jgi:putative toxin-antitoxin system antitoxin component (TIGR02293 family)
MDAPQQRAANLLGGQKVLRRSVRNPLEAHDLLLKGLPSAAVTHLVGNFVRLQMSASLEKAVGMSLRTLQRRKGVSRKSLTQDQGSRAWKFAEILAMATEALGSQDEAEQWLERPAIGLDNRRPIDLLATPSGTELVEDFLRRIDYGVYT